MPRYTVERTYAPLRWRSQTAALLAIAMAIVTIATVVAVNTPAPALADEPGAPCFYAATGHITAPPSPVFIGQSITVQWSVSSYCDTGLLAYMRGPGFYGTEPVGLTGLLQLHAPPGQGTLTWELFVSDDEMDNPGSMQVASATTYCAKACIEP